MTESVNDFDFYVGSYTKFQKKVERTTIPEDKILVVDSDLGKAVGFKRVTVARQKRLYRPKSHQKL